MGGIRGGGAGGTRIRQVNVEYDFHAIEDRWRGAWEEQGIYRAPHPSDGPKQYVLDFFPYPSGEGLSVGHGRNYVPSDVLSRYYRMRGYAVLHPMGWDAFGLPAENEAILRGRHPRQTTREYAANYRRQLTLLGCSYDWSREFTTSDPSYYKWTQWGFLLLLRRGLAYRATGWQWWCPKCRTILANEQVERGRCWRHSDTPVERRALEQWYVRTTAYADRLLRDLEGLDWPESIKAMQRNWIGRSEGVEVWFPQASSSRPADEGIVAFTTRVDTLYGVTFLALAPEHAMASKIAAPERRQMVDAYVETALRRSEIERMAESTASGVFTGASATHPLTGEAIPIYVAEYVLPHYGTGAVMGVPAHDPRDFAFARAHRLPVRRVIRGITDPGEEPYPGEGILIDSAGFTGQSSQDARTLIAEELERRRAGQRAVRYRIRDWLISRQRYWGAPIPVVHCDHCGIVPVPEDALPVLLPDVERYEPAGTGASPLAAIPDFVETACPRCTGRAKRETDTLDGFADSNWYFLRFADPQYAAGPWNPGAVAYWLPVDWYVGGAEQAVMHLLYARFFTKILFDEGLVTFSEPFSRLRNQGSMLSPVDGMRMSKSRGNVVTPDEVVARHGADALRVYVLFIGPFAQDATWNPTGIAGAARFVRRLLGLTVRVTEAPARDEVPEGREEILARLHRLVRAVGEAIEGFRFNVLVAEMMTFLNDAERWEPSWRGTAVWREVVEVFVRLCAPITPFLAEEAWSRLGHRESIHHAPWPAYDPALAAERERTVVVQVDGRTRDRFTVAGEIDRETMIELALGRERVRRTIGGRTIQNVIVVPGPLVNLVIEHTGNRGGTKPDRA